MKTLTLKDDCGDEVLVDTYTESGAVQWKGTDDEGEDQTVNVRTEDLPNLIGYLIEAEKELRYDNNSQKTTARNV